jgi:ubiquinone/menaquinone biosynthesis C-methylase UbiE
MGQSGMVLLIRMLVGGDRLRFYQTVDWQTAGDRLQNSHLNYPIYYDSQDFHGIPGGYLNPIAAITYDPITALASPPGEQRIRRHLVGAIEGHPHKILDLGCGTGSSTLMLKQAFPQAHVTGLDLSPYMLVVAVHKAQHANLDIDWHHGLAEATGFEDHSFDVVVASMLLHETPPHISQHILNECCRVLRPGGQVVILDGHQPRLRQAGWLIKLFQEPYSAVYAAECMDDWMIRAGFIKPYTQSVGWIHQLTCAVKPTLAA